MNDDVFNFPCDYPIKIIGKDLPNFESTVRNIIELHVGKLHNNQVTSSASSKGAYISLTVRIIASSRSQLDAINRSLQKCTMVAYLL
jgi:hypothetical protein